MAGHTDDPVLESARREALFSLVLWGVACAFTVTTCALLGYGRDPESLTFVLGFPDWVFWGVVLPWAVCFAVTLWFPYGFMEENDLGAEEDDVAAGKRDAGLD
jgi:hypothetical protein